MTVILAMRMARGSHLREPTVQLPVRCLDGTPFGLLLDKDPEVVELLSIGEQEGRGKEGGSRRATTRLQTPSEPLQAICHHDPPSSSPQLLIQKTAFISPLLLSSSPFSPSSIPPAHVSSRRCPVHPPGLRLLHWKHVKGPVTVWALRGHMARG